MATPASTFRAKTNFMKSWRPRNPPSNRDRLELYALHKQAISGDAPLDSATTSGSTAAATSGSRSSSSVGDKAKLNAWRGKRGMSREDAMVRYGEECERQLRVYGTRGDGGSVASATGSVGGSVGTTGGSVGVGSVGTASSSSPTRPNAPSGKRGSSRQTSETRGGETTASSSSGNNTPHATSTPQNTPANGVDQESGNDEGVLLCPRGLAAIPLLCAAASESRSAYLARLQVTDPNNGVSGVCMGENIFFWIGVSVFCVYSVWGSGLSRAVLKCAQSSWSFTHWYREFRSITSTQNQQRCLKNMMKRHIQPNIYSNGMKKNA